MGKRDMMADAHNVPSTPSDEPDADQTLYVRKPKLKAAWWLVLIMAVAIVAIAGIWEDGRLSGEAVAVDTQTVETGADKPVVSVAAELPPACQGDLSQASEQRRWYCDGFMPWKKAVDAKLAQLDERGGGGPSAPVWILIAVLVANGVVTWIMLLRRRKK